MTSSILLATDANNPQVSGAYNFTATAEEKGKQLPKPSGYRILCAIPEAEAEFEDSEVGIIKADETMRNEETLQLSCLLLIWGQTAIKTHQSFLLGHGARRRFRSCAPNIQVLVWSYMAASSASSMTILSRAL
jgi:5-deoxy-D-glucuronate isomerase